MSDTMFMETTRINEQRTVAEIQAILAEHGAQQVLLSYSGRNVEAVSFKYPIDGESIPFHLPCRWRELETLLRKSGKRPRYDDTFEGWARRVAWRQVLRWVEAQFALIGTNMVKVQEVFLPYAQHSDGTTVFERIEKKGFAQLENKG
jgi:hypothetical protein